METGPVFALQGGLSLLKVLMGSSEVMHDPRQKVKLVSRKHKMGDSLPKATAILFQVGFCQSKLQIVIHS